MDQPDPAVDAPLAGIVGLRGVLRDRVDLVDVSPGDVAGDA